MKTRTFRSLLTVAFIATLSLSSAQGVTNCVHLRMSNLAANGWKTTATSIYGGTTDASVTQQSDSGGEYFKFYTGPMNTSWKFQWAGLSTEAFAGIPLSAITSVRIRNYGISGDNVSKWQPPTFMWIVDRGDTSQRCVLWVPWTNGNPRAAGIWHEYDAATTGQWLIDDTGASYNSLAALKVALPNAYFEYSAQLPTDYGYASQQAFNVGNCPLYDEDRARFSNVQGYVDWFEIGVSNNVTHYEVGVLTNQVSVSCQATGSTLTITWPVDHRGWSLQAQTNTLTVGLTTNWVTIPGFESTNAAVLPRCPSNAVFYRIFCAP